jgi:hypothetical protein
MRKLTDLLEGRERVWFWIGDDEGLQRHFIHDCTACGCKMKPDALCGRAMSLHADRTTRFVSMLPWVYSFMPGYNVSDVLKVDYGKFAAGEDDCIMTKIGFTGGVPLM